MSWSATVCAIDPPVVHVTPRGRWVGRAGRLYLLCPTPKEPAFKLCPTAIADGQPWFAGRRVELELLQARTHESGITTLRYRTAN